MTNLLTKQNILIAPSILSADFSCLSEQCKMVLNSGADWLHCDIMDGVFVPNISFGIPVVRDLNAVCEGFLDVHLMITKPECYIEQFIKAGADSITFHLEATQNPLKCIDIIKKHNKMCGISIKPNTPARKVFPYLDFVDMVLVMSVEPGFGGQKFMPMALDKISKIRKQNENILIEVDGGITVDNVKMVIESGANVIVAGTTVFKSNDISSTIIKLRG